MFLLNLGYKWNMADEARGAVLLPSGNSSERILRSKLPEFQRILFDPQVYLSGLRGPDCSKVCARLATYPWFGVPNMPRFESSEMKRRDWEKLIQAAVIANWPGKPTENIEGACVGAIEFQIQISCTHILLPSPLIVAREDEAQAQADWLDAGLAAAEELEIGQPILATVALHDGVINEAAFSPAGFLDTVIDQTVSRAGLDGVYIVVAQTSASHPFDMSALTLQAYHYLSTAFSHAGVSHVLSNFADAFGLACMGSGATGFATGPSQTLRRLSLGAFRDEGGGLALPHLYAHRTVGEFLSQTDLDKLKAARALRVARDETVHSKPLLAALDNNSSAQALPAWVESQNNIVAAQKHFIARMSAEGRSMSRLSRQEREDAVINWLEQAMANQLFMFKLLQQGTIGGRVAPVEQWLAMIQS
jgi:hypothetical protein